MTTQRNIGRAVLALGAALAVLAGPGPLAAQDVDARWLPWIGCWAPSSEGAGVDLVCVQPAQQPSAVELLRIVDGAIAQREVLWADGQRHETSRESCTGWEQGSFSEDGRRLFLKGEYTCEGVTQETAGIVSMASPATWLDVRVAGMGGERVAWVQRYHAVSEERAAAAGVGGLLDNRAMSVATARMVAASALDVDDVIEASALAPAEAVQALLAERADPLDLNAAELIRMADAGIADDVIDVAVAVSYPQRFRLDTGGDPQVAASALDRGSLRRRWVGSAYYDPFFMPWSLRYGYGSGWYGYDRYGYGYGGYGYGGYFGGYPYGYRPTVIVVDEVGDRPAGGRVVNGRGYSRGRTTGSGGSGGSYGPPRSAGSGATGAATGSTGSSSSGKSTGRTAKPRGGGR